MQLIEFRRLVLSALRVGDADIHHSLLDQLEGFLERRNRSVTAQRDRTNQICCSNDVRHAVSRRALRRFRSGIGITPPPEPRQTGWKSLDWPSALQESRAAPRGNS